MGRERRGLPGRLPVSKLLDKFEADRLQHIAPNTGKTYKLSLATFRTFFDQLGGPPVSEVGCGNIKDYLSWRQGHRGTKKGMDRWARGPCRSTGPACMPCSPSRRSWSYGTAILLPRCAPPRRRSGPPSSSTPTSTRSCWQPATSAHAGLYVTTLAEAGLRCDSEALHLRWEDVDLEVGFLWIASGRDGHRTKSGKGRWVPMTPKLRQAMREHFARFRFATYEGQRTQWVFHHVTTRRRATAGRRIGVLRHRRVTTWLADGADVAKVREAMGHADLRTTRGYTHLVRENLRSLVESVGRSWEDSAGKDAKGRDVAGAVGA